MDYASPRFHCETGNRVFQTKLVFPCALVSCMDVEFRTAPAHLEFGPNIHSEFVVLSLSLHQVPFQQNALPEQFVKGVQHLAVQYLGLV